VRRTKPKRDWAEARAKLEREGACRRAMKRFGGDGQCDGPLEAAHIIGREHDKEPAMELEDAGDPCRENPTYWVAPDRIVPLCRRHHQMYDAHELDLLGYLTPAEEAQAVFDAGGLENARVRLCPTAYGKEAA
jgi:hypothetical protein